MLDLQQHYFILQKMTQVKYLNVSKHRLKSCSNVTAAMIDMGVKTIAGVSESSRHHKLLVTVRTCPFFEALLKPAVDKAHSTQEPFHYSQRSGSRSYVG